MRYGVLQRIQHMSASNHNYVCFDCRTAIRYPKTAAAAPKCRECGEECFCLGYKVEIPKHDDIKAWRELRAECERRELACEESISLRGVRRQHFVEQEIRRLRNLPDNRDRNRQIKKLEEELADTIRNKSGEQVAADRPLPAAQFR